VTGLLVLAVSIVVCAAGSPPETQRHFRTLSIGGVGREPKFSLELSAAGRTGKIVVKNTAGDNVQTLTCDLFREWSEPIGADLLDFHAGLFVAGLETRDLDFDGLPDIMAVRDYGAKWATHCVWLYHPDRGRFIENALSRQMEDLENLEVDLVRRQISSHTIGPTDPSIDEYRIEEGSGARARGQRLLPVRSCRQERRAPDDIMVTVVKYVEGREVVERRAVSDSCQDVCGTGCPTVHTQTKAGR
jgi:hypothetical protein